MPGDLTANELFERLCAAAAQEPYDAELAYDLAMRHLRDAVRDGRWGFAEESDLSQDIPVDPHVLPQYRLDQAWAALKPGLLAWLPSDLEPSFVDTILVRALHTQRSAAFTMGARDSALIVVDDALHDLLYEMVKLALAPWSVNDDALPRPDGATVARVARLTLGHLRWAGYLWQPVNIILSGDAALFALDVIEAAMAFVLAHEYAHVALGHVNTTSRKLSFGGDVDIVDCADPLAELTADGLATNIVFNPRAEHTVEADREFAAKLLGVGIAMATLDLLDETYYLRRPQTHPRSVVRFDLVRQRVGLPQSKDVDSRGEAATTTGPLSMLTIIDAFREELRAVPTPRAPLVEAVEAAPLMRLAADYDAESLELIDMIDIVESALLLPPSVALARLARVVFGDAAFDDPPTLVRRVVDHHMRDVVEHSGDVEASRRFVLASVAGQWWFFDTLPRLRDSEWAAALLSPSPGHPYHEWVGDLTGVVPGELVIPLVIVTEHVRRRWPDRLLLYPDPVVAVAEQWVELMLVARVTAPRNDGDSTTSK